MSWNCPACGVVVEQDSLLACPDCQHAKTSWTLRPDVTRTMTIAPTTQRFEVLVGTEVAAVPQDAPWAAEWVAATRAPVIDVAALRRLAEAGQRPGSAQIVVARVRPPTEADPSVTLEVMFGQRDVERHEVEPEPAGLRKVWDARFVFVRGVGERPALPGLHVIDVTEDDRVAPSVELSALGRRPRELPTDMADEQRRVHLLEMEDVHFHHGSAVLLPERPEDDLPVEGDQLSGLAALRVALQWAADHPEQQLLVAGHTDTSGGDELNLTLSRQRAESVLHLLSGARDPWVAIANERHTVEDLQRILLWTRASNGWPCDPGPVDGQHGPKTREALQTFQSCVNRDRGGALAEDGQLGPQTWGAIFDCYEHALARALGVDDLAQPRASLTSLDPASVGCGEHHPVDAARPDDTRNAADRRVELLFFDPSEVPSLTCHAGEACDPGACPLYGGKYRFERVPAWSGTRRVRLRLVDHAGTELVGRRYELVTSGEVHSGTVPAGGIVEHPVPDELEEARLLVYPIEDSTFAVEWTLKIADLEPVESVRGVQDRLRNLALYGGEVDDDLGPVTRRALKRFQAREGLAADGEPNAETKQALHQAHGS